MTEETISMQQFEISAQDNILYLGFFECRILMNGYRLTDETEEYTNW